MRFERHTPAGPTLAGDPGRILPLGQLGRPLQRFQRELAHGAGVQVAASPDRSPRCSGSRRPGRRAGSSPGAPSAARRGTALDLAADRAPGADADAAGPGARRRRLNQTRNMKPGLVEDADAVGQVGVGRRDVLVDGDDEGLRLALARLGRWSRGARCTMLCGERNSTSRTSGPASRSSSGRELGPDALQRGRRREQRKENLRAHGQAQHSAGGGRRAGVLYARLPMPDAPARQSCAIAPGGGGSARRTSFWARSPTPICRESWRPPSSTRSRPCSTRPIRTSTPGSWSTTPAPAVIDGAAAGADPRVPARSRGARRSSA